MEKLEEYINNHNTNHMTWAEVRDLVNRNNISEQQFYSYLQKNTKPPIVDEVLRLIVNHVFHSEEGHLFAPSHLRIDKNDNYPFLNHRK